MSNITVLGASGFIGQHLVRALAAKPENRIVAFGRFSKYQDGTEHPFANLANVSISAGDFLNREDLSAAITGAEYVFHLISSTNPAASNKDPFIDIEINVRSSVELFELCVEHGVKKVIFPSSGGTVYGDVDEELISEEVLPKPRSPYGIGKLTIEHYLRYFKYTSGLDYVSYRIANPYGPGQNIHGKQGVIPIFMHKFVANEPLTVYGDGSMVRDYIYIDDLISMITSTYDKSNGWPEYNLATGRGETVNDLISSIEHCSGLTAKREPLDTPATFVQKSVLDIKRFSDEFGKPDFTPLNEGIRRTWDYVKGL